jgi:hypothetical protein
MGLSGQSPQQGNKPRKTMTRQDITASSIYSQKIYGSAAFRCSPQEAKPAVRRSRCVWKKEAIQVTRNELKWQLWYATHLFFALK